MNWLSENINVIGACALVLISFLGWRLIYKAFAIPSVRIIELDAINTHVHLLIIHNLDKCHVHLYGASHKFEFEDITYYWTPVKRHANEVYSLCIDRKGRMQELIKVDFTSKDVKVHSYG